MNGYVCDRCPLAFEVGYYLYWDLSGGCAKYVCSQCGTMHKIEHLQKQPDRLYVAPGPVRAMVEVSSELVDGEEYKSLILPITEESWQLVGLLSTAKEPDQDRFILYQRAKAVSLDGLACAYCGGVGKLRSLEWPPSESGTWPAFGESCPVCAGPLRLKYVDTIN